MKRRQNRPKAETNILFTTTSKAHQRKRLTRFGIWAGVLLLTLSTVGVATHFVVQEVMRRMIYENPRYALREVRVEVKGNIAKKQVLQAAGVVIGKNVMRLDLKQIQMNIEGLPYVGEAQVIRLLPDKLLLKVIERVPVARLTSLRTDLNMRELLYLDRDGIIIKPQVNEALRAVPEITGGRFRDLEPGLRIEQTEALAVLQLLRQLELTPLKAMLEVHHFDVSRPLTLTLVTNEGTAVLFRLDRLDAQLERLREILDYTTSRERQLVSVDLTPEQNVPAILRN
jgi:cell division protein FtsQ